MLLDRIDNVRFFLLVLCLTFFVGNAATKVPHTLKQVGITENVGQFLDLKTSVQDVDGKSVLLSSFFNNEKPVVLFFGYFTCPMLCHYVANGFSDLVNNVSVTLGKDYEAIMLSINPLETRQSALAFKEEYTQRLTHLPSRLSWHFLRAQPNIIQHISSQMGFYFRYEDMSKEFAHSAAIMILSPTGKISRYLYGIQFDPFDFKMALREASDEKVRSNLDKLLLFCYNYDPQSRKYVVMAMRVMQIGGVVTIIVIGMMMFLFSRVKKNGLYKK